MYHKLSTIRATLRRTPGIAAVLLLLLSGLPAAVRSEILPGVLQPNDILMPWIDGVVQFSSTGDFKGWFIERGTHGITDIRGITIGPDGNFYLAAKPRDYDPSNYGDAILRFNGTTGAFIDEFVPPGSGGLSNPAGIAFLPDGNLYVASETSGNILRYNGRTGAFIDTPLPTIEVDVPIELQELYGYPARVGLEPQALVFGADGKLYIGASDRSFSAVVRYNPTTELVEAFVPFGSDSLGFLRGMTFGPDGNLYVSDASPDSGPFVRRFNGTTGAFIDRFARAPGAISSMGVGFGPEGDLYVNGGNLGSDGNGNGCFDRFDGTTGTFLSRLISADNFPPSGAGGGEFLFNKTITATGSNVSVTPLPTTSLTFSSITEAGSTVVTPLSSATTSLPENFQVADSDGGTSTYFEVETTAKLASGSYIELAVTYKPEQFPFNPAGTTPQQRWPNGQPLLLHDPDDGTPGDWSDNATENWINANDPNRTGVTIDGNHILNGVDPINHKVYGRTTSLSPFAVVRQLNQAPIAENDSVTIPKNKPAILDVLDNDDDPDGDTLTLIAITQPAHGSARINSNGTLTYDPLNGYKSLDSFTYTLSDGKGGTATATVTIDVDGKNHPPHARCDRATTVRNTAVTIAVLANDTDKDGDTLGVVGVTRSPHHGTATLQVNGTILYSPWPGFHGRDRFRYTIGDGKGKSDSAWVSVTVR